MPYDPDAQVTISAFDWVPDFARGQVRDLRPRWALEEAGIPYRLHLLDARGARPEDYYREQPFGQVPAYWDDRVHMFESGAIVLHIARDCPALLPAEAQARARATSWVFAALNSVEPMLMELGTVDLFAKGEEWATLRRPSLVEAIEKRLSRLSDSLGDKPHLEGEAFTVGDLMMASVLKALDGKDIVEKFDNLAAYRARCFARPAYRAALEAQLATFDRAEFAA